MLSFRAKAAFAPAPATVEDSPKSSPSLERAVAPPPSRRVYTGTFLQDLEQCGAALLVTTLQAGKPAMVRSAEVRRILLHFAAGEMRPRTSNSERVRERETSKKSPILLDYFYPPQLYWHILS